MSDTDPRLYQLLRHLGDRYEFEAFLGKGGAASVYRVRNLRLDRLEAIKVLTESYDEEFASRFAFEARIAAGLDHSAIVTIHDFGEAGGVFWYAMQYVGGPTLRAQLRTFGPMDPAVAAHIAVPVLDALHYSHQRGVIHRDIKPENIILDDKGRPHLADFGIAKSADSMLQTRTGLVLGTPAYVAPEQASGQDLDGRADLYALGVTLYEAICGALPFTADSALQTVVMRMSEDPEPLTGKCPDIDPELARIVMRSLQRDRELRFASAEVMAERLRRACGARGEWTLPLAEAASEPLELDGTDTGAATVMDATRRPRRGRRRELGLALAGLLATAVIVTVWTLGSIQRDEAAATARPQDVPVTEVQAMATAAVTPTPVPFPTELPPTPVPTLLQPTAPPLRRPVQYPQIKDSPPFPVPSELVELCAGTRVHLTVDVDVEGRARNVRVLDTSDPACAAAAEAGVKSWVFDPALDYEGVPVEAPMTLSARFAEVP